MRNHNIDTLAFGLALPNGELSKKLHASHKEKFLQSISEIVAYANKKFDNNYQCLVNDVIKLKENMPRYINPWFYNRYFDLLDSMQKDDMIRTQETLDVLVNATDGWSNENRITTLGLTTKWEQDRFVNEVCKAFGFDDLKAYAPEKKELEPFTSLSKKALDLIEMADAEMLAEIDELVSAIYLVCSKVNVGATSPEFFGAVYLSLPEPKETNHRILFLVEHLVHETSHILLNTVIAQDPLVLNSPEAFYESPIRKDKRPILGIYHAAFVLCRVITIFSKIEKKQLYDDQSYIKQSIVLLREKYKAAHKTIAMHGQLTPLGQKIFDSCHQCIN